MQIVGSHEERSEVHAVFAEIFRASQYATDQLLTANEKLSKGELSGVAEHLLTVATCHQKNAELSKRLIQGFHLEGMSLDDLYLGPDEIPKPGQPCSLANLNPEKH